MGIEAALKQVSAQTLNTLINYPKLIDVFFYTKYLSSEYLQNIRYRDTDLIKIATQKWLTLEQHQYWKNFCKLQFNKKPI